MRSLLLSIFIALIFLIISCRSDSEKTDEQNSEPEKLSMPVKEKTLDVPWMAVYNDSTQMMELKKNPVADASNLNAQDIVDALNIKYPQIKLEWVKQEGQKAFVKIADANYLTQQMGTTGAKSYLAEATYSLTEIRGITSVYFDFIEGDHARPQTLTRNSFRNFR